MKRAVFLDRDGTLIIDREYLHRPEEVELCPDAGPALQQLQAAGFLLILVTNQSGIGRGFFTMADVERVHDHLRDLLGRFNVRLERIYVAPEAPDQPSRGRKPSPQFLFDARDEFGLDLAQCYMVGDKRSDLECGWNAGVKQAILVRTGNGKDAERALGADKPRAIIVDDMAAAAQWITLQPRA